MKRIDLEHIIRAAAEIADDTEIIVIGSQAILGSFPNAPEILLISMEAGVHAAWSIIFYTAGKVFAKFPPIAPK